MRLTFFTLCVIAAMLPGVSAAQFKWIDASGRVNYGDTPSADARKVEQVSRPFTGDADPVATLPLEVRRAVASFPVTMYTSADCGHSPRSRSALRRIWKRSANSASATACRCSPWAGSRYRSCSPTAGMNCSTAPATRATPCCRAHGATLRHVR
jgi:hypothetical protein